MRVGVGVIVLLITLMGGRIIPSFTRNWLVRQPPGWLPVPFGRSDVVRLGAGALAIACWIARPDAWLTSASATLAGCLHTVRLPLGRISHHCRTIGSGAARRLRLCTNWFFPVEPRNCRTGFRSTLRCPAWLDGGGHRHDDARRHDTRKLGPDGAIARRSRSTQFIYAAIVVAAAARVVTAFNFACYALSISATCWVLAFGGFVLSFGPLLSKPRVEA